MEWTQHASLVEKGGTLSDDAKRLLLIFFQSADLPNLGNYGNWVQIFVPDIDSRLLNATPLYYASRCGLHTVAELILSIQGKKDLNKPSGRWGSTPLHCAVWAGHTEVVRVLLKHGADVHLSRNVMRRDDGKTELFWAGCNQDLETLEMSLQAGADPTARDLHNSNLMDDLVRHWQVEFQNLSYKISFKRQEQLIEGISGPRMNLESHLAQFRLISFILLTRMRSAQKTSPISIEDAIEDLIEDIRSGRECKNWYTKRFSIDKENTGSTEVRES
jgi:hypothetical protein